MSLKIGQNRRTTLTAGPDTGHEDARRLLGEMVENDETRTRSRVLAYKTVGRRIGRSGCWVYRLLSEQDVGLTLKTWRAIVSAYTAHSEALARAAEASRRRAEMLNREADDLEADHRRSAGGPR